MLRYLANVLQNSFFTLFNISYSKNHSSGMTREREQHRSHLKWMKYLFVFCLWHKILQTQAGTLQTNKCKFFWTRLQKNSIFFFSFSAENKSQYWYGNEQKLQSILSKKFVLSDPNLSIANHCPLFWQFTKLFFKNWLKQLNVVNNIKFQIHFEN